MSLSEGQGGSCGRGQELVVGILRVQGKKSWAGARDRVSGEVAGSIIDAGLTLARG